MNARAIQRFWDSETWTLIAVTLVLCLMGLVVLMGATKDSPSLSRIWVRQAQWFIIGVFVAGVAAMVDYRWLLRQAYVFYAAILLLLLMTEYYGTEVYGAKSWISIPFIHATLQPSEFAKLAVILVLARALSKKGSRIRGVRDFVWPIMLAAVPVLMILRQPDLGTAVVMGPITLGMLYLGGMHWSYLVLFLAPLAGFLALGTQDSPFSFNFFFVLWVAGLFVIALLMRWRNLRFWEKLLFWSAYIGSYAAMPKLWEALKPHQKSRFLVFWDPTYQLDRAGYNLWQSKIAIGSGGFWGKGFGRGTQSTLEFLPKFHTDFTFAVLGEDWGFAGCLMFFAFFFSLLYLCFQVARSTRDYQGALLAGGIVCYFLTHFSINVGMAMGMLPVTGLPLSFLSYGGSHLVVCLIGVGLVLNVKLRRYG
jgi:rod shape determining protein RodA